MSTIADPFTAFSFEVELTLVTPIPGIGQPVCAGAFSECDGLQVDMEVKSVVQGGSTQYVTHLMGQSRAGQITLRRGMTATADPWAWMAAAGRPGHVATADGRIVMLAADRTVQAAFEVRGCLPVRLRGPALNAQTGLVAVEELGLAVGSITLAGVPLGEAAIGIGLSASIGFSASAGFSANAGVSAGIGATAQVSGGLGLSGSLGGTVSGSASASVSGGLF